MFTLSDYADISRVVNDPQYAKSKGLIVKSQKLNSVKDIENKLKSIPSDDPDWREKVTTLKRQLAKAKESNQQRLYIIKYNKKSLNTENVLSLGVFRSIITDGENIVSFSPPKSLEVNDFINKAGDERYWEYTDFVEGTMINMFVNPITNEWEIATRSNIGARCRFYLDNEKTFRDMFLEAFNERHYDFSMFDKNYSYSWVLQHPDNRIVLPISKPTLILTHVFKYYKIMQNDGSICFNVENILDPSNKYEFIRGETKISIPVEHEKKSIEDYKDMYNNNYDYRVMGTVIYDISTGMRTKIRNNRYEFVKDLKGNSPKLQYRYYSLRQMGGVGEYLKYYPEDTNKFSQFRNQMHMFTDTLWRNYMRCYVHKEKPLKEFPFHYRSHMFKLHRHYIDDLKDQNGRVDKLFVINYVNQLPPGHLMHSINYPLIKQKKDQVKEVVKETIDNMCDSVIKTV